GLLGWLRFLPLGAELPVWGNVLIAAGLAGAFYGAIIGAVQRDATTVLAYSSISQIGIMLAGIGCALAAPEAGGEIVAALAVYALHHAFAKSALFFGVGAVRRGVQSRMGSLALRAALLLPAAA